MVYWALGIASVSAFVGAVLVTPAVWGRNVLPAEILLNSSIFFALAIPFVRILGIAWNRLPKQAGTPIGESDNAVQEYFQRRRFARFFKIFYSLFILLVMASIIVGTHFQLTHDFMPPPLDEKLPQFSAAAYGFAVVFLAAIFILVLIEIALNWPPPWMAHLHQKPREL